MGEDNVVFGFTKLDNGKLAYFENGIEIEDILTLVAATVSYASKVAETEIGLTENEVKDNIYRAVKIGLNEEENVIVS